MHVREGMQKSQLKWGYVEAPSLTHLPVAQISGQYAFLQYWVGNRATRESEERIRELFEDGAKLLLMLVRPLRGQILHQWDLTRGAESETC